MKAGAMLVNTSRGEIVESLDALDDALTSGPLGSAALDVFPVEPPDTAHPIFCRTNVLFSPHTAGISRAAFDAIAEVMSDSMLAVLNGEQPDNVADRTAYHKRTGRTGQ